MQPSVIINFTPTGMIPTKEHTPFVPISPDEIIEDVHRADELGITMVHLHARDDKGNPTYKADIYEKIFSGIRKHCPNLVLCASLSGRDFPEIEKRSEVLQLKPDMGSLTLSSLNFPKSASINSPDTILGLVQIMNEMGVKPELECFDSGMVNYSRYLINKGLIKAPYYYNILFGNIANVQADLAYAGLMLKDLPDDSYWALAGIGKEQLKVNTWALSVGGGVRIGLEDNIWFDQNRQKLASNIDLIKRIHVLAELFERDIMTPLEFGELGFYNDYRS